MGLNCSMPAMVSSTVGSSGTSEEEGRREWPRASKKDRKRSRISAPLCHNPREQRVGVSSGGGYKRWELQTVGVTSATKSGWGGRREREGVKQAVQGGKQRGAEA